MVRRDEQPQGRKVAEPEAKDDEPFRFADECQLCGADLRSPEPGNSYVLGGIIAMPNDAGQTSAVCVCDACLRYHRDGTRGEGPSAALN